MIIYLIYLLKIVVMFFYSKMNLGFLDNLAGYAVLQTLLDLVCPTWLSCLIALVAMIPIVGFIFRRCIFLGTAKHIYFIFVAVLTLVAVFI